MRWRQLNKALFAQLWPGRRRGKSQPARAGRAPMAHVVILDGTMSSLDVGSETNAGLTYRLLSGTGASVYYEAGVQWADWRSTPDVLMGRGINRQIRRAYGWLASRYQDGDTIYLFGYSRGAYAVRSLAGVIDTVGLLRKDAANERNIRDAYRHYQGAAGGAASKAFRAAHSHATCRIEMVGVWDTVKALGLRLPILWKWTEEAHAFHNHELGPSVQRGFHALALDETRLVFAPELWDSRKCAAGRIEQVWFPGAHGDVGGQLGGRDAARPLSNIPLVWMLERAEACGLSLPPDWRGGFEVNPDAPSVGTWRGWGKLFLLRRRRQIGRDPSERLHGTAMGRDVQLGLLQRAEVQPAPEPMAQHTDATSLTLRSLPVAEFSGLLVRMPRGALSAAAALGHEIGAVLRRRR